MKTIRRVILPIIGTVLDLLKKYWAVIPGIVIVGLLIWVIFGVYVQGRGWADWTGFGKYTASTSSTGSTTTTVVNYRTLWDLLDLLIIPLVLAIGAWALNKAERSAEREAAEKRAETDREIALDRQRQTTLQAYYDRMTDLLLEKGLGDAPEDDPIRDIARTQTLATLRGLDGARKRQVVQFLIEAGLTDGVLNIEGADLSKANLSKVNLNGVNLNRVDLSEADLSGAYLSGADLSGAYLIGANLIGGDLVGIDLSGAVLRQADLRAANLSEARLSGADLIEADLRMADLSGADLREVMYDTDTGWPADFDPEAAGAILVE